jgi:hypothetical protein
MYISRQEFGSSFDIFSFPSAGIAENSGARGGNGSAVETGVREREKGR